MRWKTLSILLFVQPIFLFCFQPLTFIDSEDKSVATLLNSVSFHPDKNLFCVTYTHQNRVVLYQILEDDSVKEMQVLKNPVAQSSYPADAIFSPDGKELLIINLVTPSITVHSVQPDGNFQVYPHSLIPCKLPSKKQIPHGMCLSADGKYLAVTFASYEDCPWIILLYRVLGLGTDHVKLQHCSSLKMRKNIKGVPKGIAFTPDQSSLAITFIRTNSVEIFSIEKDRINPIPTQVLSGSATQLYRPEDIVFSPSGNYCAVSNSGEDNVSFYQFDKTKNHFISDVPFKIINANLCFPHGLDFSPDGKYFAITQFGPLTVDHNGRLLSWGEDRFEGIFLYKVKDDDIPK